MANTRINKTRYWTAVLYPENMKPDWEESIGEILQLPYAYCIHSKDKDSKSEHRKDHVHIIIAFANTTTYKHALEIFQLLSAEGKKALNTCEAVINMRYCYDYLIHDTETAQKQGKELYDKSARITGNNFDIGAYEQLSLAERNNISKEICNIINNEFIMNFADLFNYIEQYYADDSRYYEVLESKSSFFERLTRGNFQKWYFEKKMKNTEHHF